LLEEQEDWMSGVAADCVAPAPRHDHAAPGMTENRTPARMETLPARHVVALDGLRGVAILLVMVYHFVDLLGPSRGWFLHLLKVGWVGVDLFFVLSGYLITGILLDTRSSDRCLSSFYMRRFLRIFPLYYGILIALIWVLPLVRQPSNSAHVFLLEHQAWYWTYTTNVLIAWNGTFTGVTGGFFWSLAVEEQFYLVWPFLVGLMSRVALTRLCLGLLVVSPLLRLALNSMGCPATALYVLPFTRMDPLLMGALLALMARAPEVAPRTGRWLKIAGAVSAAILVGLFIRLGRLPFWDDTVVVYGLTPLALVFGYATWSTLTAPSASLLKGLLSTRLLVSFGKFSYAIYLFHLAGGYAVKSLVINPANYQSGTFALTLFIYLMLASALSWCLGWLSWHLFEKHFLALKRLFPAQSGARAGASTSLLLSQTQA
jgi:peptidoglycan/LPS O-acetylase OafA/YrhL